MDIRFVEMLVFFRYLIVENIYFILNIIIRLLYVKMPCKFKHSSIVATIQSKRPPCSMVIDLEPDKTQFVGVVYFCTTFCLIFVSKINEPPLYHRIH